MACCGTTTSYDIDKLPTFPSTWTAPTSCFATTNYYRVFLSRGIFSNLYGTPTPVLTGIWPTGDCFPPSSTPMVPYVTDGGCPAGYTRACATAGPDYKGKPASTVTCCPSVTNNVFSFMCRDHQYGCHATATLGGAWTGTETNLAISPPTEKPITLTQPNTKEGVEAWGIKLISTAPDLPSTTMTISDTTTSDTKTTQVQSVNAVDQFSSSSFSSSSSSSSHPADLGSLGSGNNSDNTSSSSSGSGLETGVLVGIVVGCVAATALLALAAFLLYRRQLNKRYTAEAAAAAIAAAAASPSVDKDKVMYQLDDQPTAHMLYSAGPGGGPEGPARNGVWEMQG
ncbi:hypothetical protein N656DRAFT_784493 [Canariomyces notabilis]|uniref:Mid2 domain-containing protein n=1 Tax=Canariomyces notabilis TaxID=2074819 RepID=A0AAN6QDH7_9PEZI|nr:hypothetical protein N656DRAFT_784493 [Canariomyces arenarius]